MDSLRCGSKDLTNSHKVNHLISLLQYLFKFYLIEKALLKVMHYSWNESKENVPSAAKYFKRQPDWRTILFIYISYKFLMYMNENLIKVLPFCYIKFVKICGFFFLIFRLCCVETEKNSYWFSWKNSIPSLEPVNNCQFRKLQLWITGNYPQFVLR